MPALILSAALGLALVQTARQSCSTSLVVFVSAALVIACVPVSGAWQEPIFLGCWISVAVTALLVHVRHGPGPHARLAVSINAGCFCGALIALSGAPIDLFVCLPCVLVVVPAAWTVRRWRAPVVVKIVASWLVAVAVLASLLQVLPLTPGYLPDHLD